MANTTEIPERRIDAVEWSWEFAAQLPVLEPAVAERLACLVVAEPGERRAGLVSLLLDPVEAAGLLDQPALVAAVVESAAGALPKALVSYVQVRQRLLRVGVGDRKVAAYLSSVWQGICRDGLLNHVAGEDSGFLETVAVLRQLYQLEGRAEFELLARSANYYLFLLALFRRHIDERQAVLGGPGAAYYEAFARCAFRAARDHGCSGEMALADVYDLLSERLGEVREALQGLDTAVAKSS